MQSYVLLLLVPVYMVCHTPKNNSDVIVTYEGHAEAGDRAVLRQPKPQEDQQPKMEQPSEPVNLVTERDEVIFMPNERAGQDDGYLSNEKTVGNLFNNRRRLEDIVARENVDVDTESPKNDDVVFVTGKNNERVVDLSPPAKKHTDTGIERNRNTQKPLKSNTLDCANLGCNKTSSPVCGGKIEHNRWRYRLFLNECFFRKVNCAFNYDINRYTEVERGRCHNVSSTYKERPYYRPEPQIQTMEKDVLSDTRRSFSGRRSSNSDLEGNFCGHSCPTACPEDYKPECAVSSSGERRVFVNHCKLDYDSCLHSVAWRKRPLSECAGAAAELRQNRGFISWMHRVGIIDGRGRLAVAN